MAAYPAGAKSKLKVLSAAFRKNATSLGQAQNTYKQNVAMVNTYIAGVLSSSLPTLNSYPPDWATFVTAYEQAGSDALNWVNNVMARLLDVPGNVQGYNGVISQLLQDAQNQADILVSQPTNQGALASLNQDLAGLSSQLNLITAFISGAITNVQNFQDVLPNLATQLQTIAQNSINDAHADQQQINQLNAQVQQLQSDISSLTASIIALGIVDGVALTLGIVATVAAFPVGALAWLVMGPAVAVATTFIALDAEQIKADQSAISATEASITGITADVSTLTLLSNNYAQMASQTAQIQAALQAILQAWQTLESDVAGAISDINAAIADTSSSSFAAVAADVSEAITEWNAAYAQAGSLTIELQVSNAQLQVGMSSSAVQSALAAAGPTVNIIQYYNGLTARAAA